MYMPISLLPTFSKIVEKLMHIRLFSFPRNTKGYLFRAPRGLDFLILSLLYFFLIFPDFSVFVIKYLFPDLNYFMSE